MCVCVCVCVCVFVRLCVCVFVCVCAVSYTHLTLPAIFRLGVAVGTEMIAQDREGRVRGRDDTMTR